MQLIIKKEISISDRFFSKRQNKYWRFGFISYPKRESNTNFTNGQISRVKNRVSAKLGLVMYNNKLLRHNLKEFTFPVRFFNSYSSKWKRLTTFFWKTLLNIWLWWWSGNRVIVPPEDKIRWYILVMFI